MRFALLSEGVYLPADYWLQLVPQSCGIEVEIGSGDGRFLAAAAKRRPQVLMVGCEIRRSLVDKSRRATAALPNVRIYRLDARWLVCHLLATESVDAFHLRFPDPWWKKRHYKRRLFTADFCAGISRCLREHGTVALITDVSRQFQWICRQMCAAGFRRLPATQDPDSREASGYEARYRRQGRSLFACSFEKGARAG